MDAGVAAASEVVPGEMAGLFRLEAAGTDTFRAEGITDDAEPGQPKRMFGGQVAAQALAAAGHTVTGARPHSLHCYFLRPGDVGQPVLFGVDRLHDGRTFRRRRVTATQDGAPIACLDASFTADSEFTAEGNGAADYPPPPPVPAPEDCPVFVPGTGFGGCRSPWDLLSARFVPGDNHVPYAFAATSDVWFRVRGEQAADVRPEVMLTYLSDLTFAATMLRPSRPNPAGRRDVAGLSSLDHCAWFHHPADLSDWLLFAKTPAVTSTARGLGTGRVFNRDGTLAATVTQEALLHLRRD